MLVKYGVFHEIVWYRLTPSHSHDFVDRVFLAVEQWLTDSPPRRVNRRHAKMRRGDPDLRAEG